MPELIASGDIAGLILLLTLLELLGFAWLRRTWNFGPGVVKLLPSIAAGDFLLLAWWFSAAHWALAALSLIGALAAHVLDVASRIRPKSATSKPRSSPRLKQLYESGPEV